MEVQSPEKLERIQVGSRSTCLYCYFPFQVARASAHCPGCGELNLKADQKTYWSREPKLVRIEGALKVLVAILICGLMAALLGGTGGFGIGQGWAIGLPLLLGWLLWETTGLVTRRRAALDMRVVWPMVFVCIGLAPTLFFGTFMLITADPVQGARESTDVVGIGVFWTIPWLVPAWLCLVLTRFLARKRDARIASGATNGGRSSPPMGYPDAPPTAP